MPISQVDNPLRSCVDSNTDEVELLNVVFGNLRHRMFPMHVSIKQYLEAFGY